MQKLIPILVLILTGCHNRTADRYSSTGITSHLDSTVIEPPVDTTYKVIHVLVALCDNTYQGIVPVPAKIGNGQDPDNNLYWGCAGGIRTFFKKSAHWKLVKQYDENGNKLERVVFRHARERYFLIADAYDGKEIKNCTVDFLKSCAGILKDTLMYNGLAIGINGHAKLLAYIGHNGLMDFSLDKTFVNKDNITRDALILACISKRYFSSYISQAGARPLLWSTGLMSPEAYTLHDALESYIKQEPVENIRIAAAKAYSKYQKCSIKASKNLLVSGF